VRALILSFLVFLLGLFVASGCNVEQLLEQLPEESRPRATQTATSSPAGSSQRLRVASFNIQVLGQSKLDKPEAMATLTQIVKRFDIVAIQELRSKEQDVIPTWLKAINADGSNYTALVGPRLGRTVSKEQYVFLYNQNRIEFVPRTDFTINDPLDLLHREPYVATFRASSALSTNPFQFTLINIHTDPDETDEELDALAEVYEVVRQSNPAEDDVILLGDLNVDHEHLGMLGQISNIAWTVSGTPTNTRKSKSYDNIVFDKVATTEFVGNAGVLDYQAEYGLTLDQALEVSDHMPVWAEFSVQEATGRAVAGVPATVR